jgi:hypothetical protein
MKYNRPPERQDSKDSSEKIMFFMKDQLWKEGYRPLSYHTHYKVVSDGAGGRYVRIGKITRDSNTQSVQLNRISLNELDIKDIANVLKEHRK